MAGANITNREANGGPLIPPACSLECDKTPISSADLERNLDEEKEKIKRSLEKLSSSTGMSIIEENGQRRFGPPVDYDGVPPPEGSEVFVGRLPRDCYEPELVPVLEQVGRIFKMRLMLNLSGRNKGFCFVTYYNPEDAEKAIKELNNFEIRKGWYIGVTRSLNKRDLFIKDLPKHKDEEEIRYLINRLGEGVINISVPKPVSYDQRIKNRGFCFVNFDCHKSAVSFLARWYTGQIRIFNDNVIVEWADLVPDPYSISVTNLSPVTTEEGLLGIFNKMSNNGVVRVDKQHNRAYIYFRSQHEADLAKHSLNGALIDGCKIRIKLNILNTNPRTSSDQETDLVSSEHENIDTQADGANHPDSSINEQDSSKMNDAYICEDSTGESQLMCGNNTVAMNPINGFPNFPYNNFQNPPVFPPQGLNLSPAAFTYVPQGQIYPIMNAFTPMPIMVPTQPVMFGVYGFGSYIPSPAYILPCPVIPQPQQPL